MWYKHWHTIDRYERERLRSVIVSKLPDITKAAHDKGWPSSALSRVMDYFYADVRRAHGISAVVINDEYLLLYVVGSSWWHDKPYLCEEFLLSLTPGGDFPACLAVIEALAKDEGCGAVCIGTAASPSNEVYARLLNRHGYKTLAYQLVKEIQWEQER